VLLVRFEFPTTTVWALPGGGLDPGETHLDALHRELIEEVGLYDPVVGAHVWNREHIVAFEDGLWDGQQDRFYLVETTEQFEPTPALSWEQLRSERLHELRWWHVDDIEWAASADVVFAPTALGRHLRMLISDGPPTAPIDTGV
jgi:8-oxo-dGTP pyrophosphatase MutT (NUDIX family)